MMDCENAASKRWLLPYGYRSLDVTVLEDDLYCHRFFCQLLLAQLFNFILVYHRPASHTTLHEALDSIRVPTVVTERWTGTVEEADIYRYLNQVPPKDGEDALLVNWCELTVPRPDGKVTDKNAFATNHTITDETVTAIVRARQMCWKVENENNKTLKIKGYNLEHNFGHGKLRISSFLSTLNSLFILFYTWLERLDQKYKRLDAHLPTRKSFFNDLRALARCLYFDRWEHLLTFMLEALDLDIPPNTS